MPKGSERPLINPLGMLLCEAVSRDIVKGQLHLNGICDTVTTNELPCRYSFAAFTSYSEARGSLYAQYRIVDSSDHLIEQSKLAELPVGIDPLQDQTFIAHFSNVEFPESGLYFVQLWVKGVYIMERRLVVAVTEERERT